MDVNSFEEVLDWKSTKEAVANFRRLLLCSKCSSLMKEPVCLGMCEHMLCRSCAGPQAGDGCTVCISPAWVKDIQINRQLGSIVQLFCGLESLLNPTQPEPAKESLAEADATVLKHKKNFKIWFSPRTRKVRCRVEKPIHVPAPTQISSGEDISAALDTSNTSSQDLSIFNFTSSSQDSSSSPSRKGKSVKQINKKKSVRNNANRSCEQMSRTVRVTREQKKQNIKKKRLETINQQWGITVEHLESSQLQTRRSSKKVSFLCPDQPLSQPPVNMLEDHCTPDFNPAQDTATENTTKGMTSVPENLVSVQNLPDSNEQSDKVCTNISSPKENQARTLTPGYEPMRTKLEEKTSVLESTPTRPRTCTIQRRRSLTQISPSVPNSTSSATPSKTKSPKNSRRGGSADTQCRSPCSPGRPNSGSPAFLKRNHKGETPLHLAAIKGDGKAVEDLLDQGADPNLKDNAGWTPLHEACNLGHLAVVELLTSRGALLNTPGYENDSPLHDAVRNGHLAIVKLLLQLGASRNVLNLHGKRPADYAVSPEMLDLFQGASDRIQHAKSLTPHSPSASLSMGSECAEVDQTVVLLASKLSRQEQQQLVKLGVLLEGRVCDTFSASGVGACLRAGRRLPEGEHEAGDGPERSRRNKCSWLPPLFDGCFFFLLGSFKTPTKDELTRLLREGGGQLLSRQPKPDSDVTQTLSAAAYHATPDSDQALCTQYIIYDPRSSYKPAAVRRGKVWSAPSTWIVDCITSFCLLPVPEPQPKV